MISNVNLEKPLLKSEAPPKRPGNRPKAEVAEELRIRLGRS